MSQPQPRKLFVTTALPYANGAFHIGHIMEYIQADIWVRFQRMQGNEVNFVGADDAHGAPIMIAAEKANMTPQEFVAGIAAGRKQYLDGFHIAFDNWHSTDGPENHQLSQDIYRSLRDDAKLISVKTVEQFFDPVKAMFLPDRYIKGECPKCHAKDQYGDSCEVCGKTYSPTDLIDPYSVISGAKPERKASEHHFFKLSDARCEKFLRGFTQSGERLQLEAANKMKEWLGEPGENKLADWDISRDAPYFGFPIPGTNNQKFFYVWLDAPVGYFGSFRNYFEKIGRSQLDIDAFLRPGGSTEMVHFIGKDILYFHALFWPAMLEFAGYRVPTKVFAHGFLTVDGQKMSKSRGTFITAESYLEQGLNPEWLRYYYAAKLNSTMEDIDLNLEDFVARVNSDLVGKYVNIASRCAGFIAKQFDGKLSQSQKTLGELNRNLQAVRGVAFVVQEAFDAREYGKAIREIMKAVDTVNVYVDEMQPWFLAKDPSKREQLHEVCTRALFSFKTLTILLTPMLPHTSRRVAMELFGMNREFVWPDLEDIPESILSYKHLLTRIDPKQITALVEANKESLQPAPQSLSPQRHAQH